MVLAEDLSETRGVSETFLRDHGISLFDLHLSKTLQVNESTPVGECVDRMLARKAGSVLVMSDRNADEAVGIFTERDLLKWYRRIIKPDAEFLPIRNFLTRGVISIPHSQINTAGKVMLERGIRHLLVVRDPVPGKSVEILGMISMRDLFRALIDKTGGIVDPNALKFRDMILISAVEDTRRVVRTIMNRFQFINLVTVDHVGEPDAPAYHQSDLLILDLDQQLPEKWFQYLDGLLHREERASRVILLYHPQAHDQKTIARLETFAHDHVIQVVAKPVTQELLIDWLTD